MLLNFYRVFSKTFWAQASRLILLNPRFNKPEEDAFTPQRFWNAASTSLRVSCPIPIVEATCAFLEALRPVSGVSSLNRSLVYPV
ncbi:MAG: hypothetical protein QW385_08530 [Thermoproteota archaeon]